MNCACAFPQEPAAAGDPCFFCAELLTLHLLTQPGYGEELVWHFWRGNSMHALAFAQSTQACKTDDDDV